MDVIVYIDGFNLFYGSLKHNPGTKWLDLVALCSRLLPHDNVVAIKYYTARAQGTPDNPQAPTRQQTYLRALGTLAPVVSVHYGHFIRKPVRMANVHPPPNTVEVWKTEEKGSDVNLATHMVVDGFRQNYELAVVISNDGDLKEPARFVREELGLRIGVFDPHPRRSFALSPPALPRGSFYRKLRLGPIRASQFPATLQDAQGTFSRPAAW